MVTKIYDFIIAELLPKPLSSAKMNVALLVFIYISRCTPQALVTGKKFKSLMLFYGNY